MSAGLDAGELEGLLDERLGAIHGPVSAAVEPGSVAYFLPETPHREVDDATLRRHLVEKLERVLAGLVLVEGPAMPMAGLVERLARRWERARAAFDALPPAAATASARHLWFTALVLDAVRVAAGHDALFALRLDRPVATALRASGFEPGEAAHLSQLALVVASRVGHGRVEELSALLATAPARAYLNVHEHAGTTWFDKARFEALCRALETAAIGGEDPEEDVVPEAPAEPAQAAPPAATAQAPTAASPATTAPGAGAKMEPVEPKPPAPPAAKAVPVAEPAPRPAPPAPVKATARAAGPKPPVKPAAPSPATAATPVTPASASSPAKPAATVTAAPAVGAGVEAPPAEVTTESLIHLAATAGYRLDALVEALAPLLSPIAATRLSPEVQEPGDPEGEE